MSPFFRYTGLVAIWILAGQVMSLCGAKVEARQIPNCNQCNGTLCCSDPCWDSVYEQESTCGYAQQGCLTSGPACGGEATGDLEPICCGSGVDCICPGYEYLGDWDRVCNPGYGSYCCCHDTCCRDYGWFGCLTFCWAICTAGCYSL